MRLPPGAKLGRYEVIAHVGSGGMGDVYRARDEHLDRQVALKTIGGAYALDPASQPRFERERRLGATLEHPHICRLLDAGRESGIDYLAMELLDGESLADRLARGPLPVDVAIGCAIEIADALSYAHHKGVIHRDLKPGNVFLTHTGAKVLDFGLATYRRVQAGDERLLRADTVPLDGSAAGTVVGSAPYMAPERLEGADADTRTDVFAFGLVLYEMLTGRRAFDASSPAAMIAAILSKEPPPLEITHPRGVDLEWVVRKCLAKVPDDRWQSMTDVHAVLKRIAGKGLTAADIPAHARRPFVAMALAAVTAAAAVALVATWLMLRRPDSVSARGTLAFTVNPPDGGRFTATEGSLQTAQLSLSPDGRSLAFVATGDNSPPRLWLRRLDSVIPVPLAGTENASFPFWAPDGRSLGFFANGLLRRVEIAGGPPRTLAAAAFGRGGTWSRDGQILFAPSTRGPLQRVPADGGTAAVDVTTLDASRQETGHRWPHYLPDGRRFLYFVASDSEAFEGVYLGSVTGGPSRLLTNASSAAAVLAPDRILFLSDSTLVARSLDAERGELKGDPVVVAERVGASSNHYGAFSAAAATIAYASSALTSDLVWYDRRGRPVGTLYGAGQHVDFRLSPDGRMLAVSEVRDQSGSADIYLGDLTRGQKGRLTSARRTDASPVWSPDGRTLVFRSNRAGSTHDIYRADARGVGPQTPLVTSNTGKYPTSWSADGRVAFHTTNPDTKYDVMVVDAQAGGPARPLVASPFNDMQAQFSPDGKWVAYTSDDSGPREVYVAGRSGTRRQVSVSGGMDPRWRADGRELFYRTSSGQLAAVEVRAAGDALVLSSPRELFPMPAGADGSAPYTVTYDVAPDAQRFLVRVPREHAASSPLTVLLDWSGRQDH